MNFFTSPVAKDKVMPPKSMMTTCLYTVCAHRACDFAYSSVSMN